MDEKQNALLHASCVSFQGRGLLILGASGAGKSTLALGMMALGAGLVADDRVWIAHEGEKLIASCPSAISGRIEARGVGILRATPAKPAPLMLAVDLDQPEPQRLPPSRKLDLLGLSIHLVLGQGRDHLAPVLLQYLRAGCAYPDEP